MNLRSIRQIVPAQATSDGAGVSLRRSLGTPALKHLDPFLMLDHFGSEDPDEYIAGFPEHPHRGFITFTYMLDGHMEHRDSMGNRGDLQAGGAQWMKAASGVLHSEMPRQANGRMRGFQLWINLPAAEKMSDPEYREFPAAAIPEVAEEGARVRLLAGEHAGVKGALADAVTDLLYLDVRLSPAATFRRALPDAHQAFVYLYEGEGALAGQTLATHDLAVLGEGDGFALTAGGQGAGFILVAGRPIGESIVQYGPFVMNTREEIEEALADYRAGRLVRAAAATPEG